MDVIPDEAWVVRGGQNRPEDLLRGTATHPSGLTGVSVESGTAVSVQDLSRPLPHGHVGLTTVAHIRALGGDVVRTNGRSPYHATVVGLSPDLLSSLLTPPIPNPGRKRP